MILSEVNSFVDLVIKVTSFANQLQEGWYKGSAEVNSFKDQVLILTQRHSQWSAQLRRHGLSEDERLLQAVQAAIQVLDEQEKYVKRLQKSHFWRLIRKAFPGQLSNSLNRVLAIVDAGPQLLEARVSTHDLMERSRARTPAQLPFISDLNYVPISESILEIRKALEDQEGPRVVTVFGGPGLGKSSMVKYLALHFQKEKSHSVRGTQPETVSFPDGVFYLFCGKGAKDRVQQLQLELLECLGFGKRSAARPDHSMGTGVQKGDDLQVHSHQMKLRSHLAEQELLIVLDDVWEWEVLRQLLVPVKGVKFLITSQMREVWGPAARIQMRNPTREEARQIMSNYTKGLPTKGKFPENIQIVTDAIIQKLEYHPLSLADIGSSINSSRATDISHWEAISDNIQVVLDEDDKLQGGPILFDQPYNLTVKASMMLMVEALQPEAKRLLFLLALLGGQHLSETLVRYFYKFMQSHQNSNLLWKYNNDEKYLEERSLVELHSHPGCDPMLAAHQLRIHYIQENRTVDLRSIASDILASSDQVGGQLIQMGDAESTLVTILSAIYFKKPFTDVVGERLENHIRILNGGFISRNINYSGTDPLDLVKTTGGVASLVSLLNIDDGDHDWKQQAHEYAKKIIIKLACRGELDDCSMAHLLQLSGATSIGCKALEIILHCSPSITESPFDENHKTFSSTHCETMNTLLTLWQDDATSTKTRVTIARALMQILNFESKDTIVNVASKFTEFLAIDSNSTLQTDLAESLRANGWATRSVIMTGEFTTILEVLMGLLVFGKAWEVRRSAGYTLNWFSQWKCTALKIAAIPNAVDNLFDLFLSKDTLPTTRMVRGTRFRSPSSFAGDILSGLSCVEENRMRFRAVKSGLDGLGNILARMEASWWSTPQQKEREELEQRASIAAGILGELGLEKELRDYIGLLPGVEGGLLFLQTIEMARQLTRNVDWRSGWIYPSSPTRALAILFSNYSNPRSSGVPSVEQLQEMFSCGKRPSAQPSLVADLLYQFRVHWTLVLTHVDMGTCKAALENLKVSQHHLDQISKLGYDHDRILVQTSPPWYKLSATGWSAMEVLSSTRMFLQAMLEDHPGALLSANKRVAQEAKDGDFLARALTQRGIVKRFSRDLQGALDDLNAAYAAALWRHDERYAILKHRGYVKHLMQDERGALWRHDERYVILKHRGYVKHLMQDDRGAKEDAEAAQKLKFNRTMVEKTMDCRRFWGFRKLPINYLGHFL